jgi:hypothetical protein
MDWKIDPGFPDTDTSTVRPVYRDSGARMIAHQYQGPQWLSAKISETNKNEISRIYGAGHCINLMLYFVSCTYTQETGEFSYPLNDQFLSDYAQLLDAYKVGGGPLYIQAFPEFEIWYGDKSAAVQDAYRAKIVSHYRKMVQITRASYSNAYIGLCFFTRDFVGNTSQFYTRWDPVISISDVVWVNAMTTFRQWNMHAEEYIKSTRLLSTNWGLPIIFPFVEIWADKNTPIFGQTGSYQEDAQFFSNCITNWIGRVFTSPAEITSGSVTNWATNLRTLKSRNLLAFSLYAAHYNKPVAPPDPDGVVHPLESYTVLTNLMRSTARDYLYPIHETEFWQNSSNAPVASADWFIQEDTNCSSGALVSMDSAQPGDYITFKVPVTRNATYRVLTRIRKQSDGGKFRLRIDGAALPQDTERDSSTSNSGKDYAELDHGLIEFRDVTRTHWAEFSLMVTGAGEGGGHKLAVDCIKLESQVAPMIPQTPTGLQAVGAGDGKLLLIWNKVAGAESYILKRSFSRNGPFAVVVASLTENRYVDTGLENGVTCHYVVSAVNSVGEGPESAAVSGMPATMVVDNADAEGVTVGGVWTLSASTTGFNGLNYLHDGNTGSGKSVRFTPNLPAGGRYQVYLRWTSEMNRASNVPIDVNHADGTTTLSVNQRLNGGAWLLAGVFRFEAGTFGNVVIRNTGANGYVIADAVRFVHLPAPPPVLQAECVDGEFRLSFSSQAGYRYYLELKQILNASGWTTLRSIEGTGGIINLADPLSSTSRLYRIRVE